MLLLLHSAGAFAVAERVISLSPHATELAYAAGMGDKLIAVSAHSDYPPEAQKLEQVSSWQGINIERVLALKPDLVLAWRGGNPQKIIDQLAGFGIKVLYVDPQNIQQIAESLDQLAQYSPNPEQAHQAAQQLLAEQQSVKQQYSRTDHAPVEVFLQFGNQPLFTSSSGTLQNEIVELCGGKNIFVDSPVPWPQVSKEQVLTRKPQMIIIAGEESQVKNVQDFWHELLDIPVIAVPEDYFNRSGPRIMRAAEIICPKLSPK
ncbi:MAG: vitamin B12 ABC transporter substrate-binding protein BtuF [Enterobacteriaceae bacterium]|jgi:vitamin B12 transport system substrate-binding protein|nr:vitamin B12 ABC transporter substrate-binding protein BtuF [Enterobacteriaceae bacterium]